MTRLRLLLPVLSLGVALVPLTAPPASAAATLRPPTEYLTPTLASLQGMSNPPELFGAPAVGDISGDGEPDIVAGYQNGHVVAWHLNGSRFLDLNVGGKVHSTPTLVDLDRNGVLDVLGASEKGTVYAYDGKGRRLFLKAPPSYNGQIGIFASPVAADIDGDGVLEVIATGWNHHVHVWDLAGRDKRGFPVFMKDTIWSSPAIADLNGDGKRDIVFGYDCLWSQGAACQAASGKGAGFVTALNHLGKPLPGWPRAVPGQVVWSTPAIGDITGDGRPDVVVGTGLFNPAPAGSAVFAWDRSGHLLPGWPAKTRGRVMASPALGDVNGDGTLEVSVMDEHNWVWLFNGKGQVVPGFPVCGGNTGRCDNLAHAGSVLADVTGDGRPDVVAAGQTTLRVWDSAGHLKLTARTPSGVAGVTAPPTVTQLDGEATILLNSTHAYPNGSRKGTVVRFGTGVPLGPAPWPMFRQSARGTSHVDDLVAPSVTTLVATAASTTVVRVAMTASDAASGVAAFDTYYRIDGGALVSWLRGAAPASRSGDTSTLTRNLRVQPGHTYRFQVRARDKDGNYGRWGTTDITVPA